MKDIKNIIVSAANVAHLPYVSRINDSIDLASKERGTGIARRSDEYITNKIMEGKAIIALEGELFAGFCYIESWGHNRFVANSGLIVVNDYRGIGLAREIKKKAFELSRTKFPNAKIFGLTTGLAVMKINHELGYRPVTFSELTTDESFWKGCQSCVNYDILTRTGRSKCLCTGMLFDPAWEKKPEKDKAQKEEKPKRSSLMEMIGKLKSKSNSNSNGKDSGISMFKRIKQNISDGTVSAVILGLIIFK
ncbi:GNAT family N-acetyltransferase [uncultured Sunxiuqinia sp.]|uniref:GNAT family N-acetyltransferase n=1 Tax=uncultured Sunxiuqinia sp. TaxID=1573825 RepID=UPI002AA68F1A|nr:GNAT family N-acetyltransferase [uncultured Sunxiuqinia sp.]